MRTLTEKPKIYSKEPIAIVGIGSILPDAMNTDELWGNLVSGKYSIFEVPKHRWDPKLYYNEDKSAPDKTYAKIGAFIENF